MKILVVGGSGHIGTRVVSTLRSEPRFDVWVAGRRPSQYAQGVELRVDAPETFEQVSEYDVVINCTDTYSLSPVPLFEHCLRHDLVYVETTADTSSYIDLYHCAESIPADARRGSAILGMGIFPGLSNILAGDAARLLDRCESLDLHLSWSVLSGAGSGTCEVMVQSLARPIRHARDGEIVEAAPIGKPQAVDVFEGLATGFELGLPESFLLWKSTDARNTSVIVSTRPEGPKITLQATHWATSRGWCRPRFVQSVMRGAFHVIRAGILAKRSTPLEMVAVARASQHADSVIKRLRCKDAFQAAADVMLCCLSALERKGHLRPQVYTADELFTTDQVMTEHDERSLRNITRP